MADKKFELEINSKLTGDGLEKADRQAEKLGNTIQETNRTLGTASGAGGLQQFLDATADKARVTEIAFYDLDAQLRKNKDTSEQVTTGTDKMGRSFKFSSTGLLQLAQTADDAQYGLRGILNNIPGLVMGLGGGAGLAGAISIAAIGLSQLSNLFDENDKKAEKFQADLDAIGRNAAANILDKLQERARELEIADEMSAIDRAPDKAGQDAAARAAQARLEQLRTINEVSKELNQLLERQTNALEEIAQLERQRKAEREAAAAEAIRAEEEKVAVAKKALIDAQSAYDRKQEEAANTATQLRQAREELELIRQKRDALVEISKQKAPLFPDDVVHINVATPEAKAARKQLPDIESQVAIAEQKREQLETAAEGVVKSIDTLYVKIYEAEKKFREQSAGSQQEIDTILEKAGTQKTVDQFNTATQANSEILGRLQKIAAEAEGQTGVARQAADGIQAAIADGQLTAQELQRLPTDIQTLIGAFKGDVRRLLSISEGLVPSINENASRLLRLEGEVQRLNQRLTTAPPIR